MSHLFEPLRLRGVTLPNRIAVSPMCQYSATDGCANEWHYVHYGSRAVGGAGLLISEAMAVVPEGRISPHDLGLWNDQQIEPLRRINDFIHAQGCISGIQLAHAGRKAAVPVGWQAQRTLPATEGGWQPVGPSPLPFSEAHAVPRELDHAAIAAVVRAFADAAGRALAAGYRVAEIHSAHGYLLHQFLSPISNQRKDKYGGALVNRCRLLHEVLASVRQVWPEELPLLVRLSATDWLEGGWTLDESVELSRQLATMGVDLIDTSSGGTSLQAKFPVGAGYQTGFAERIRREAGIATGAVGLITEPAQADHILRSGQADLVLLGREVLRDPYWPMNAARTLGHATAWPAQYLRAAPTGAPARQPA